VTDTPSGLKAGGAALWAAVTEAHTLDAMQEVQLLEACRCKDRLDALAPIIEAEPASDALVRANATANLLKQLLAALRVGEAAGAPRRAGNPGTPRGAYITGKGPGTVSSLDRALA
jgi:hypothetical protein